MHDRGSEIAQLATTDEVQSAVLGRLRLKKAPAAAETTPVDTARQEVGERITDAIERRRALEAVERQPDLALEYGKLCLVRGNIDRALEIFKSLCARFLNLTTEQAHVAFWFLFQSLQKKKVTTAEFLEHHSLLVAAEGHFRVSFRDIVQINELELAFQRGFGTELPNNEGNTESGYEEVIRVGEALAPFGNVRTEAERRKRIGASYLMLAERERDFFSEAKERGYVGADGEAKFRLEQLNLLRKAGDHTKTAVDLLEHRLPLMEMEGGEALYVRYNLAKILVQKAITQPGDRKAFDEASLAITRLQVASQMAQNRMLEGFAHILYGELLRYGENEQPSQQGIEMAIMENMAALETGSDDTQLQLSVFINIGELFIKLEELKSEEPTYDAARAYISEAAQIFYDRADFRIVQWGAKALLKLAKKVGVTVRLPKHLDFSG